MRGFVVYESLFGNTARIAQGELMVLVGPSGSGKTTLLNSSRASTGRPPGGCGWVTVR